MIERYVDAILKAYPRLPVVSVRMDQHGHHNTIVVLNESLIFRFPRRRESIDSLLRETAVLRAIRGPLPLGIPNPTLTNIGSSEVDIPFFGYEMVRGESLSLDRFAAIENPLVTVRVADQLAAFLRVLHRIDVRRLAPYGIPSADDPPAWRTLYSRIRERLYPHMSEAGQHLATEQFEELLGDPDRLAYQPALRHGDFGTANLIFDPLRGRMTGVVDFSSLAIGDPAVDLAGLARFGDDFVARLLVTYPELEAMLPRARLYGATFALQEALYGLEEDHPDAFEAGIAAYR